MAERPEGSHLPQADGDVGDKQSIWLRPLRLLLEQGKPPGNVTMLAFGHPSRGALPFGALSYTSKRRLVFWPVLPKRFGGAIDSQGISRDLDHLTLELPSRKIHVTWFEGGSRRKHYSASWRLHEFEDTRLSLLVKLAVRWSILEDQDRIVERLIPSPSSDAERRKAAISDYARKLGWFTVALPPGEPKGDYVFTVLYFVENTPGALRLTSEAFLQGGNVEDIIDGWPDGEFAIQGSRLRVGEADIVVATACPPGRLRRPLFLGFPRASKHS